MLVRPLNKCALTLISRVLDLNHQAFTGFGELCHRDLKSQEIRLYTAKHNLLQILTQKLAIALTSHPLNFARDNIEIRYNDFQETNYAAARSLSTADF